MKCSNCGSDIGPGANFCPSCGRNASEVATERREVAKTPKKKTALWAAIAGVCVVAIIAIAMVLASRGKVTQATPVPGPTQAPVVSVPGRPDTPQPSVLNTDVKNPPIELNKAEKPQPPADVVAYLEHLKKVEQMRQDVTAKELNDLVAMAPDLIAKAYPFDDEDFDAPKAPKKLANQAGKYTQDWQEVAKFFLSVPPPQACATLSTKYYDSLREFVSFMTRFQDAISKSDLSGLKDMKRNQTDMDTKLNEADKELANVCSANGIDKSFSIKSDTGQTPLTGF